MIGIYQIRNVITGAVYVGSTKDLARRKVDHFKMLRAGRHPSGHLQNSVIKHGIESFVFEILVECGADFLLEMEQAEIDRVVGVAGRKALYNANPSAARTEWTAESKEKLRQRRLGESNPFFGKRHTPEAGAKMSASRRGRATWNKGKTATPEHRAAIAAGQVGRKHSDETKKKMAETHKRLKAEGKAFGPDHIAAIKAAQQARRQREKARTDL